MKSLKTFNGVKLYSYNSKNKVLIWYAESDLELDSEGRIPITIYYGQQGGKILQKIRYVNSGKNKGKSNETTIVDQTYLEIGYLYQKQFDQGYVDDITKYKVPKRPMLAYKYKEKCHKIVWVADKARKEVLQYASKKLNGIRCFIFIKDGSVTLFESRTGKPFKFFKHISDDIQNNYKFKNEILDGELFHPDIPFEIICSLVNSDDYVEVTDPDTGKVWSTNDIRFYCYDKVNEDLEEQTFYERFILSNWHSAKSTAIHIVESIPVYSETEMIDLAKKWIDEGFEGLMLRAGNGLYEFGKRSINLLKYKVMEQEEFKIILLYLAENDDNKIMATLSNHHNKEEPYNKFDCALKGNKDLNLEYYKNKSEYEHKAWMTVDYQVLSSYKVPLFPVGVIIRKGEVVDGEFIPSV